MAISCLGFNTIALFSRQIFKIDDAPVNASLIFWFCFAEMICSVPRNSPMGDYQNIWLTSEHSEPIGTIRTLAYGPTQKSPPSVQAVFQVTPAPISSRFLCPRLPLSLCSPNQNRHATQASCTPVETKNKDGDQQKPDKRKLINKVQFVWVVTPLYLFWDYFFFKTSGGHCFLQFCHIGKSPLIACS